MFPYSTTRGSIFKVSQTNFKEIYWALRKKNNFRQPWDIFRKNQTFGECIKISDKFDFASKTEVVFCLEQNAGDANTLRKYILKIVIVNDCLFVARACKLQIKDYLEIIFEWTNCQICMGTCMDEPMTQKCSLSRFPKKYTP